MDPLESRSFEAGAQHAGRDGGTPPSNRLVEEAVRFLVDRGLDEQEVREGSVPGASLDFMAATVWERLPTGRPVRALQIGNFVGVSLCYLSELLSRRHPDSVVVSIDPNVPHRGISDPLSHLLALLHRFQLRESNVIITGYTLERTADAQTSQEYLAASENVLPQLAHIGARFDLVLIDGNHEQQYLAREVALIPQMLEATGIIVLDDVKDWEGVATVFRHAAADEGLQQLANDGRIGILEAVQPRSTIL